jgi:ATP synthase
MSGDSNSERLKASVQAQTNQIHKAEIQRRTLLANTIYLGTLGLILVLPIVAGACGGIGWSQRYGRIPGVISKLAKELPKFPANTWKIIRNFYDSEGSRIEVNSPFEFSRLPVTPAFAFAPLLNVPPVELRLPIIEQFLFALFYRIFYLSFTAENHERLRHMEGAMNKIRDQQQRLKQVANSLRQESITEDLEIILLSVDGATA